MIPIRPGSLPAPLSQPSTGGAPVRSPFAARLAPGSAVAATAGAASISGRDIVAAALEGRTSPRSYAAMLAPITSALDGAGQVVEALAGQAGDSAELLQLVDDVKTYIMTNSIFDAANTPTVDPI